MSPALKVICSTGCFRSSYVSLKKISDLATLVWTAFIFLMLAAPAPAASLTDIHTVFLIVMENQNWPELKGNTNCPYINGTLLPMASHCEHYYSPTNLHPSLPNYLWLVAGTNFGILDDNPPDNHLQNTTNHLAAQLDAAGLSWRTISPGSWRQLSAHEPPYPYCIDFDPFLYFGNILTNTGYCLSHIRPLKDSPVISPATRWRRSTSSPPDCGVPCTTADRRPATPFWPCLCR